MALHWNLEGIADRQTVCFMLAVDDERMSGIKRGERILNPVTNALIWATMAVGIGKLTADNVDEFWTRLQLLDRLDGGSFCEDMDGTKLDRGDVERHVGLSTNVTNETRAKWIKRVVDGWWRDQAWRQSRAEPRKPFLWEQAQAALVTEFGPEGRADVA